MNTSFYPLSKFWTTKIEIEFWRSLHPILFLQKPQISQTFLLISAGFSNGESDEERDG